MTVRLYNVNWPEELRKHFIETVTKFGAEIRTAKHKDRESGFYFYLIEITKTDTFDCLKALQESFKFYYTKETPEAHYGFTYERSDYVADYNGNLCICETLRSVSVPADLAEKVIAATNRITESVWYLSYGDYCDFYMLDGDILNLILTIKHQQDIHYQDTIIRELTYTYNENFYTYPAVPKMTDKKPVKNYTIHTVDCPIDFICIIVRLLIWNSIPASCDSATVIKAPATKSLIIDSLNRAYAVYIAESGDTRDHLIFIESTPYVFSYYRRRLVQVVGHKNIVDTGNNLQELKRFLDYENIYQSTFDGIWYIEQKKYKEFLKKGEELLKSNGSTFTWSV